MTIADPWDSSLTKEITVQGRNLGPVQVFPPRVLITSNNSDRSMAKVIVRTKAPSPQLSLGPVPGNDRLVVTKLSADDSQKIHIFRINLSEAKATASGTDDLELPVTGAGEGVDPVIIPVRIVGLEP